MKTKKELKETYKQIKPIAGVFQISNQSNQKFLIEAGRDMISKWNRHRTELRFGSHRNKQLQKDWNDLGEDNFTYKVLSELDIDDDSIDINKEVNLLKEMILEELNISEEMKY